MLPHVVRWNAEVAGPLYADLLDGSGSPDPLAGERLAGELEQVAATCGFPLSLAEAGVREDALPALAEAAAAQWTGGFNPRPVTSESALRCTGRRGAADRSGRTMLCAWRWSSSGPHGRTRTWLRNQKFKLLTSIGRTLGNDVVANALTSRRELAEYLGDLAVSRAAGAGHSTPASPTVDHRDWREHFAGRLHGRGLELGPLHRPHPDAPRHADDLRRPHRPGDAAARVSEAGAAHRAGRRPRRRRDAGDGRRRPASTS